MGSAPIKNAQSTNENINYKNTRMENLKQALIENIADILDSEDVQREEILNDISDPIKREKSELHISMAEAALAEYKRMCEGKECSDEGKALPIQDVNGWLCLKGNEKLLNDSDDCLLKFDTGEIRRYNEEDLPNAIITHFRLF